MTKWSNLKMVKTEYVKESIVILFDFKLALGIFKCLMIHDVLA